MVCQFYNMRFKCSSFPVLVYVSVTQLLLLYLVGKSHPLIVGANNPRTFENSLKNYSDSNAISVRTREPIVSSNSTISQSILPGLDTDFYNASFREARRSVVSGGIFSLVSFENVPCNGTTGDVGVCYSIRECQNLGGTPAGPCAGSYGVCCVLTAGCGSTITINNTYIVNPGWPSATTGPLSCTITINVLPGASQLYLEYDKFILDDPTNGDCTTDSMMVTVPGVTGSTYPVLCGVNTGQNGINEVTPLIVYKVKQKHVNISDYIGLSQATGPVKITFNLAANSDQRCWKIRVVEFKPTDLCAAPAGCTQYLRDVSGTIESYNYNGGQGHFLNNYCINICFKTHPGYCNLLLTEGSFMLSGIAPSDCTGDYLLANGMKFCGETLNNGMLQVNCSTGPIMITVCSDKICNPDSDVGYSLNYNFLPTTMG